MKRILLIAAFLLTAVPMAAQERPGRGTPDVHFKPGWTFTPSVGLSETYDDNISLFGRNTAEQQNNDLITTYSPAADLHYSGRRMQLGFGYTGGLLNYRTFSELNRWDQRASFEMRRQESASFKWFAHANGALIPSTDLIDLGGIPFRHTGARTANLRAGGEYVLGSHNSISSSVGYQAVDFDRPDELRAYLRGGQVLESINTWRRRLSARFAAGVDYTFRRAQVVGDTEIFSMHATQAAVDYDLSPTWSLSGAGGIVYMQATPTLPARTGPALRLEIARSREGRTFHAAYLQSYIPSFGFGGTIENKEASVGFRFPLSRHFYTDNAAVFRDDQPLTNTVLQLPLRSLRTYSTLGWTPDDWVRFEVFYARVQQTSLQPGGALFRNRVGFQIVTSKPMRMQ